MFDELQKTCKPGTSLCIAAELTLPGEYIKTMQIGMWAKEKPDLHKRPAVFLLSV
jgi:16S rRNA (cytidine1402-2'-O)-methyltransferase